MNFLTLNPHSLMLLLRTLSPLYALPNKRSLNAESTCAHACPMIYSAPLQLVHCLSSTNAKPANAYVAISGVPVNRSKLKTGARSLNLRSNRDSSVDIKLGYGVTSPTPRCRQERHCEWLLAARLDTLCVPLFAHLAFAAKVLMTGAVSVQEPIISIDLRLRAFCIPVSGKLCGYARHIAYAGP